MSNTKKNILVFIIIVIGLVIAFSANSVIHSYTKTGVGGAILAGVVFLLDPIWAAAFFFISGDDPTKDYKRRLAFIAYCVLLIAAVFPAAVGMYNNALGDSWGTDAKVLYAMTLAGIIYVARAACMAELYFDFIGLRMMRDTNLDEPLE